jgi:PAS domain-containing protein
MSGKTRQSASVSRQKSKKVAKRKLAKDVVGTTSTGKSPSGESTSTPGGEPAPDIVETSPSVEEAGREDQFEIGSATTKTVGSEKSDAGKRARKQAKERKKTIKSLRLSDSKARALLNVIDVGLAFHDLVRDADGKPVDYRVREVNPAFEATLELVAVETIGDLASRVYGKRGRAPFLEDIVEAVETGEARAFEGTVKSVQGRLRFSVQPMEKDLFALLIEDVSEEAKTRRRLAFLETRVRTISGERKDGLVALAQAQSEAHDLRLQIKSLRANRDSALKQAASRTAAVEREALKVEQERKMRERVKSDLAAASEVCDNLNEIIGNLSRALKAK